MNTRCAAAIWFSICGVIACGDDGGDPRDPECWDRDPVCDAPDAPLDTALSRGVTGVAMYESDVLQQGCEAECGAIPSVTLLVVTDALVDSSDAAAAVLAGVTADAWVEHDGYFDLEADEGPHLFCMRAPNRESEPAWCIGVDFGADTVVSAVLMTVFGPSALYVTDNTAGTPFAPFPVDVE